MFSPHPMSTFTNLCLTPSMKGEPGGAILDDEDADALLARASGLEDAGELEAAADVVDRALHAGRCTTSMALLFARLAEDLGREAEALGALRGVLGSHAPHPPRVAASLRGADARAAGAIRRGVRSRHAG
jgi:hypothetical protein